MAEKVKIETDKELDITEEKKELTLEERVEALEAARNQQIIVTNNLITYCNTIEKWRKMDFVPPQDENSDNSEENETPVEETNED
jgi:hypothetical protein